MLCIKSHFLRVSQETKISLSTKLPRSTRHSNLLIVFMKGIFTNMSHEPIMFSKFLLASVIRHFCLSLYTLMLFSIAIFSPIMLTPAPESKRNVSSLAFLKLVELETWPSVCDCPWAVFTLFTFYAKWDLYKVVTTQPNVQPNFNSIQYLVWATTHLHSKF